MNDDIAYFYSKIVESKNAFSAEFWLRHAKYILKPKEYHKLFRLLHTLPEEARIKGLAL